MIDVELQNLSVFDADTIRAAHSDFVGLSFCYFSTLSISAFSNSFALGPPRYGAEWTGLVWLFRNLMQLLSVVVHLSWPLLTDWKSDNMDGNIPPNCAYFSDSCTSVRQCSLKHFAASFWMTWCRVIFDYRFFVVYNVLRQHCLRLKSSS